MSQARSGGEIGRHSAVFLRPIDPVIVEGEPDDCLDILPEVTGHVRASFDQVCLDRFGAEMPFVGTRKVNVAAARIKRRYPSQIGNRGGVAEDRSARLG